MYTIGQFAKLGQVSLKLLRFYDRIGLLEPAHIHPENGYRYYTLDQLSRLNRIIALKNLGLSLNEVRDFLEDDLSIDELRGMLKFKQAQLRQQIEREQQRLREVETRLYQLELADPLHTYDIALKPSPILRGVSRRKRIATGEEIQPLFDELRQTLRALKVSAGMFMGLFHLHDFVEESCQSDVVFSLCDGRKIQCHQLPGSSAAEFEAVCTLDSIPVQFPEEIRELPSETIASLVYRGSFAARHFGYLAFSHWATQSGYCVCGAVREVYLRVHDTPYHSDNLLEIQVPVQKIVLGENE